MIQITKSISRIDFSSLTCVKLSWNVKFNSFSFGIDLVLQSTLYKFIVWAVSIWVPYDFGSNPISILKISHYKIITYFRASCSFMNSFHNDAKTLFFLTFLANSTSLMRKKKQKILFIISSLLSHEKLIHKIKQVYIIYLLYYLTNPNTIHGSQLPHQEIYPMFRL